MAHYTSQGYIDGPYDQHAPGSDIVISEQHKRHCGFRDCSTTISSLSVLRRHLRSQHDLQVAAGGRKKQHRVVPASAPATKFGGILSVSIGRLGYRLWEDTSYSIILSDSLIIPPVWFDYSRAMELSKTLGGDYVQINNSKVAYHQLVVLFEILRRTHGHTVHYMTDWPSTRRLMDTKNSPYIVFFWASPVRDYYQMRDAMDKVTDVFGDHVMIPTLEEWRWDQAKIYDIKCLDQIAIEEAAYRPQSCFAGLQDNFHNPDYACELPAGVRSVLKRSHSANSNGITVEAEGGAAIPMCKQRRRRSNVQRGNIYEYIHQEYVRSLDELGEFRVFIATRAISDSNREREPYVVHAVRTHWGQEKSARGENSKEPDLIVQANPLTECDRFPDWTSLRGRDIFHFALRIFKKLLSKPTWQKGYATLRIGARIDIGIGPNGTDLFVNEVTRIYSADFFQQDTLGPPHDTICKAYAEVIAELYPVSQS